MRNDYSQALLAFTFLIAAGTLLEAQNTTWTDGGADGSWSKASNWSNGVPTGNSTVTFANPISVVGLDTGGPTAVAAISVSSGTDAFQIAAFGGETLSNGNFLNDSSNQVDVNLDYTVSGNSTLDGPISFNGLVNVGTKSATIAGVINLNSVVALQLTSVSSYGRLLVGSGATLAFGGGANSVTFAGSTYSGVNGNVFTLVSNSGGTVTGLNLALFDVGTLPTLSGGLSWDTSNLGSGILAVTVPEPSTWLLLTAGLTIMVVFRRRRRD